MGTITQLSNKVRLTGGAIDDFGSGVRMYSRAVVTKPFRIRFKLTRKVIPTTTTANGAYNLAGWVTTTQSAPTSSPATWPSNTATGDVEVTAFLKGFRFSPGNINTVGTASTNRLRMQTYNGDNTKTQFTTDRVIDIGLNVEQEMELAVSVDSATLAAIGLGLSESFSSPIIAGMTTGYFMIYTSFGMDSEWADFRRIS